MESNRYTLRLLPVILALLLVDKWLIGQFGAAIYSSSLIKLTAVAVASILTSLLLFAFSCLAVLPISTNHRTFRSALKHFLLNLTFFIGGAYCWREFEKATKEPKKYQELFLNELLYRNADTEYGRAAGFKDIKSREEFRQKHPLTTYETFKPFIERLKKGEQGLLTKDPVYRFCDSSGTTGVPKLLPSTRYNLTTLLRRFLMPAIFRGQQLNGESRLAPLKSNLLLTAPHWYYTEGGLSVGPLSGTPPERVKSYPLNHAALPNEVAFEHFAEHAQLYLRWLYALYDRDLERIEATFAGVVIGAVAVLQKHWPSLVDDIRHGKISTEVGIPSEIIEKLASNNLIWADPQRADEIEGELSRGFEGIFHRLWPRMRVCYAAVTGCHKIYRQQLHWYCGKEIHVYTAALMASEGGYGINVDSISRADDDDSHEQVFTLHPSAMFMEFIDEDDVKQPNPRTYFMDELQVGKRYELVITTFIGVYRYRLGDLLEVVRLRHGKTPVVKYCARVGSILDLVGEKTSEDVIFMALQRASANWDGCGALREFTTTVPTVWSKWQDKRNNSDSHSSSVSGQTELYYVIFVESEGLSRQLTSEEVAGFDKELCSVNELYKYYRDLESFTMAKVYVVEHGTFLKMKEKTLAQKNGISNQYKTPRYVTNDLHLGLLSSAIISTSK